jgi:hypothetical protein
MAKVITISAPKAARGDGMSKGTGWRLAATKGRKRIFVATLLHTIKIGNKRIAIFSIPK